MMKSILTAISAAACLIVSANAAVQTFDVSAVDHGVNPSPTGIATGILLEAGDTFRVTAAAGDTWVLGSGASRITNADGTAAFGNYTDPTSGQSFLFGSLVGQIGGGDYFFVGVDFDGIAEAAGELVLFVWDGNLADNSGDIRVSVFTADPVPVPPALGLMALGLIGFGMIRSRKTAG